MLGKDVPAPGQLLSIAEMAACSFGFEIWRLRLVEAAPGHACRAEHELLHEGAKGLPPESSISASAIS